MWHAGPHTGDTFPLAFYNSSLMGTNISSPSATYDIGPDIKNGAGWLDSGTASEVKYIALDWDNSQLYVLDAGVSGSVNRDARVHVFTVKSTPDVRNVNVTNIMDNSADMVGYLPLQTADVRCYWGTSDGGTNPASWYTNTLLGSVTGPATFTNSVAGLANGTIYFFRYWASNGVGSAWATNTLQFATTGADPAPRVDNGSGPGNVTTTGARLQGRVLAGTPDPQVWFYWGASDGTNNKASWTQPPISMGPRGISSFFSDVSGLPANQTYWYRCYGSNSNSEAWSPASSNFTTVAPNIDIGSVSVTEGNAGTTAMVFTVTLSATSAVAVSVAFGTADGTATLADNDYVQTNGTLTIPAGSVAGQIAVLVNGDTTRELAETVLLNLSNAVNGAITTSSATGTINNDDWTLYVRNGGAGNGNGMTWANAFSNLQQAVDAFVVDPTIPTWTINVEASAAGQAYDVASRNTDVTGLHTYANFEGGWQNVDATPSQTGISVVKDLDGVVDEPGLRLYTPEPVCATHQHRKVIGINRFVFTNVAEGVRLTNAGNGGDSEVRLRLSNTSIFAASNGVWLSYGAGNPTAVTTASNVIIRAGLAAPGHGIYLAHNPGGSVIEKASVSSARGKGVFMQGICGTGWINGYTVTVRDSDVSGCLSDGIDMGDDTFWHYASPVYAVLDRVKLTNNGGHGFYRRQDNGNAAGMSIYSHQPFFLYATNVVAAGNGGSGIYLDGVDNLDSGDSLEGAPMVAWVLNSTVANNGGDGLRVWSEPYGTNGAARAFNTIFSGNAGNAISLADWTNGTPTLVESSNDYFGNGGSNLVVIGSNGTVTNYPVLQADDLLVDPKFGVLPPEPYRLAVGSPLLDAGTNALAPAVDILLIPRPFGLRVSIGAYEKWTPPPAGTAVLFR